VLGPLSLGLKKCSHSIQEWDDPVLNRVMTRIVIVGLYYKSKIVGLTLDSGIESQNSAVLSPGSGMCLTCQNGGL